MTDVKELDDLQSTVLATVSAVLGSPGATQLIDRANDARDSVLRIQDVVLAALNIPSASEFSLLHGRVRSVSERLETIEDQLDEVTRRIRAISAILQEIDDRTAKERL